MPAARAAEGPGPRERPAAAGPERPLPPRGKEGRPGRAMRRAPPPLPPCRGARRASRRARPFPGSRQRCLHSRGGRRHRGAGEGSGEARGPTALRERAAPAASDLPPASPFMARSGAAPAGVRVLRCRASPARRPPRDGSGRRGPPGGGRAQSLGNGGGGGRGGSR